MLHDIARNKANGIGAVGVAQVAVLLIRECFEGRGVDDALAPLYREPDGVFRDKGFASASGGGNHHRLIIGKMSNRFELEWINRERVACFERFDALQCRL